MKFKCKKCGNIFDERLQKGEKVVKYPHGIMIDANNRMDIIYCEKCKSEKVGKLTQLTGGKDGI